MNKLLLAAVLFGLGSGVVSGATVDQRLNTIEDNMYHLDQSLMDVNNDSVVRDLNLQKQINELKKQGYDDSEIKQALAEHGEKQTELADKLIQQETNHTNLASSMTSLQNDMDDLRNESRKGISQAIAIAGLEYPTYDDEHKLKIAIGTGTYKGQTSVAYGVAYMPNYDTIVSIKGSDNSVACSVGVNL